MKRSPLFVFFPCLCLAAYAEDLTPAQRAEYEKTIQIYTSGVIPQNPKDARSYQIRGFAYFSLGQNDLALVDYSQAIRFASSFGDHYVDRAFVYEALGQYDKALGDFNAAIRISPQRGPFYSGRARVFWNLKHYDQAGHDYQQAVALDPRNADACNLLAWFLVNCPDGKLRDEARAVQLAQRACSLLPNNTVYQQTLESAQAALKKRTDPKTNEFKSLEDLLKKNGK